MYIWTRSRRVALIRAQLTTAVATGDVAGTAAACHALGTSAELDPALLFAAAKAGHVGVVSQLLDLIDVDVRGVRGATAFIASAATGRADIVALLLSRGADGDAVDDAGWSGAHYAAAAGHLSVLKEIAKGTGHGAASRAAALADGGSVIQRLGVRRTTDGATPLMLAASEGQTAAVTWLLSLGVDVDAAMSPTCVTALMCAAQKDGAASAACVRALAQGGAALNTLASDGRSALAIAAQHNALQPMHELLAMGAMHSPQGTPVDDVPLAIAVRRGHADAARLLLQHGANAQGRLSDGRPLLLAAVQGVPRGAMTQGTPHGVLV